jgi:carbamoyltransferase
MKKIDKEKNIIIGFHSGHDCSYCILEDGVPVVHEELERITRIKEGNGDGLKFFFDRNPNLKDKVHTFSHCHHAPGVRDLGDVNLFDEMIIMTKEGGGKYHEIGHHKSHAAHAHYSSRFDNSLIISLDAGGWDFNNNPEPNWKNVLLQAKYFDKKNSHVSSVSVFRGVKNKIHDVKIFPVEAVNVGGIWHDSLGPLFGLSSGPPKGNQSGTIMAMAAIGEEAAFMNEFYGSFLNPGTFQTVHMPHIKKYLKEKENNKYNVAKGLQKATEKVIKELIGLHIKEDDKYICFTGGVALNSVTMGKVLEWFPQLEDIFIPIVPYDGGLAIGSAQYVYHHIMDNPKLTNEEYFKPYLGINYSEERVKEDLEKFKDKITIEIKNDEEVVKLLAKNNIISVFNGKSESGRRALGNRSILADPRSEEMKDLINEKVKHRQWFRPFAPSIIREETEEWFERFVDSPYMGVVVPFKKDKRDKVPAVVHLDGTGRLQTVSEDINKWYYNFLKIWQKESGVPILLNTSFNDREPIVETPEDAIKCFLGTDIDYLYFPQYHLLIEKKK